LGASSSSLGVDVVVSSVSAGIDFGALSCGSGGDLGELSGTDVEPCDSGGFRRFVLDTEQFEYLLSPDNKDLIVFESVALLTQTFGVKNVSDLLEIDLQVSLF
jgi:hypothetical protein